MMRRVWSSVVWSLFVLIGMNSCVTTKGDFDLTLEGVERPVDAEN
ncbi:hypothetical protein [Halosquirtibacter xylanolyticus]